MMLLLSDVLYMMVRYTSQSGPMCLRCMMLTLSGPVELLFCFIAAIGSALDFNFERLRVRSPLREKFSRKILM